MPRWTPMQIVGASYADDAKPWTHQDTVNYIPVPAEKEGVRSSAILRCLPGYTAFCDLGTGAPIRGMRNVEGSLFVVSGQTLFKVSQTGSATSLGTIPGASRCSLTHNQVTGGNQVAISNGQAGYVYNTAANTLEQITDEGFPGAISFDFVDGYILGVEPGRRFAFTSDLASATSYSTLDQFEAEGAPDLLVGQAVTHREWWLMGERTIEPFVNTGATTGTFQRSQGTVIEVGLAATHAVAVMDNSVFWLGNDGIVYRANGYIPQRISTHAIEQAIARCTLNKALAFTFEDRGHKVFYLTFQDGQTWGYDAATGEWHRRQSYGLNRWRVNELVKWNGKWIAGDYSNGKLYQLNWDVQHEDGLPLERRRITGVTHDSHNGLIINGVALVVDTGVDAPATTLSAMTISGALTDGFVGQAYTAQFTQSGGYAPISWRASAGQIPPGLSIDDSGLVSGAPTTTGTYTPTISASDTSGRSASSPQSMTVSLSSDILSITGTTFSINSGQTAAFALGQQLSVPNAQAIGASDLGARVAIGLSATPWVSTYKLVSGSYVKDSPTSYTDYTSLADIVALSRDGTWLCVGGSSGWKVAHDNGSGTFSTIATHTQVGTPWTAAFSSSNDYLAHSGSGTPLKVYQIIGTTLTALTVPANGSDFFYAKDVAWHHGGLLAIAENQLLAVLTVAGTSITVTARYDDVITTNYQNVAWSPDGAHLYSLVNDNGVAAVRVFGWNGSTLTRLADASAPGGAVLGTSCQLMALSRQGNVLFVVTTTGTHAYTVAGPALTPISIGALPASTIGLTFKQPASWL